MERQKTARINMNELMSRVENDRALAQELLSIFIEEFPGKLQMLAQAVTRGDLSEARILSHALKGALLNISVTQAAGKAANVEQTARDGNVAQVMRAFAAFEQEVDGLLPELQAHLEGDQ